MLSRRLEALTATGLFMVLLGSPTQPGTAHPATPVAIPVSIQGGQGSPTGARPMVQVRVGNSKSVPVLLDTGSTGLQIYAPAVNTGPGGGVTVTSARDAITYAGGHRFTGVIASAVIRIGSQATAGRVRFGLVRRAFCVAAKPTCDAARGVGVPMKDGAYGILGIGMNRTPLGLFSPILGMPGRLGQTWSLHLKARAGILELAPRTVARARIKATVRLEGGVKSGGHASWADGRVHLCVAVGPVHACPPGLFDSGTFTMQLWGHPLNTAPVTPGTARVLPGTRVAISVPGARTPFWRLKAGATKSRDSLTVESQHARSFVNYGVQSFYAFTIAYDERGGTISLLSAG
jgi:hypothetical protein